MPAIPKLSVVIPTMDRPALFIETLSTIVPQLSSEVELVVLDSGKDSQPVKEATQKAGGKYLWQSPRGFDQAYLDVVNMAQGEYVWLFGDDDLMKPHAIEKVLGILKSSQPDHSNKFIPLDLLIVNADVIGSDSSRILKERCSPHPETQFGPEDRSELVAKIGGLMSFMGSVIVRKTFWSQNAAAAGHYVGTRLITMIVPLLLPARRAHFIPAVLVSLRYGHQSWMGTSAILIGKTMTDIIWSLDGIEDFAKQACTPRPPFWNSLLLWRALGQPVGALPYLRAKFIGAIPAPIVRWLCRTAIRLLGKTNSMTGITLGFNP